MESTLKIGAKVVIIRHGEKSLIGKTGVIEAMSPVGKDFVLTIKLDNIGRKIKCLDPQLERIW